MWISWSGFETVRLCVRSNLSSLKINSYVHSWTCMNHLNLANKTMWWNTEERKWWWYEEVLKCTIIGWQNGLSALHSGTELTTERNLHEDEWWIAWRGNDMRMNDEWHGVWMTWSSRFQITKVSSANLSSVYLHRDNSKKDIQFYSLLNSQSCPRWYYASITGLSRVSNSCRFDFYG